MMSVSLLEVSVKLMRIVEPLLGAAQVVGVCLGVRAFTAVKSSATIVKTTTNVSHGVVAIINVPNSTNVRRHARETTIV